MRMRGNPTRSRLRNAAALLLVGWVLGACSHTPSLHLNDHYAMFNAQPAKGSTVYVCHAYGCRKQTKIRFGKAEIAEIRALMKKTKKGDTPTEERRAIAYAIAWMERYTGKITGTSADRAGMDFTASGDPTQQDCVDEATNTTSYLTVLQNNDLLKYHTVSVPFAKENYFRGVAGWTHWTAVLHERGTDKKWAVDSWIFANGVNPAVVETNKWYIAGLDTLPDSTK
jgi:hypothetical protein